MLFGHLSVVFGQMSIKSSAHFSIEFLDFVVVELYELIIYFEGFFFPLYSFFFYSCTCGIWKFLGKEGSNQRCIFHPKPQPQQHWLLNPLSKAKELNLLTRGHYVMFLIC